MSRSALCVLTSIIAILSVTMPAFAQRTVDDLTRVQEWEPRRSSSANEDLGRNGDARPIPIFGGCRHSSTS